MLMLVCLIAMPVQVSAAKLNKKTASVYTGKTVQLKVTGAGNSVVTWKSSKPSVAKVGAKGKVTGVKKGTAVISAKVNGKTYKCKVTVKQKKVKAQSVALNKTSYFMMPGKTWTPKVTVKPSNTTDKRVTWKSSNPSVAKVSSKGVVTAVANGNAVITATTKDGSKKSASCKIFVLQSSSSASQQPATPQNGESALARKFLTLLQKYSDQVKSDKEKGIVWAYSNSGAASTWSGALEKAQKNGITYCNCALLARWGLRELGILNSKNFWGVEGGGIMYGTNNKNEQEVKTQLLKHCEIIRVYKTPNQLLKEGKLLPGDICTWVEYGHTNVYAGDGLWFDAGRNGTIGGYKNGKFVFNSFGPAAAVNMSGTRVGYIIRLIK